MGGARTSANSDDTFAKLMRVNAWVRGERPAFRLKEFGIWRTWTWSQAYQETRALAQGLADLGIGQGDRVAVAGANWPRLYWTITAAQMLGAIPVPLYADAVADEIAAVLELAGAKLIVAQDQEQVDKMLSILPRLPAVERVLYEEKRGLDDYADPRLGALDYVIAQGRRRLADPTLSAAMDGRIDAGRGSDPSVILFTSGTTGRSKGVVLTGERCIAAARDTVAFDNLTDRDEVLAYLPLAWVGDHYLNYAQGFVAGFCMACPESAATAGEDLREIGPTYHFAPPRVFEALLTRVMIRMEDASAFKRWLFRHFMDVAKRWGETIVNRQPAPLTARLHYALGRLLIYEPLKNTLGLTRVRVAYTAGEAIGAELFAFYRSLGLNLKQLYGQTEAFLYVTAQADGAVRSDTVGPPAPHVELRLTPEGEVQFKSPGMFVGYFQEPDKTAEALTEDGFVKTGDAGVFEPDGQLEDRRPRQGRRPARQRAIVRAQIYREQAQVLRRHPRGGGARRGARLRRGHAQHRIGERRQLGGAQRHRLRLLSGARRPSRGGQARRQACRGGQPGAERRPAHGGRPDQALPHPAQGARRRRRRAYPHAESQAPLHRRALRAAGRGAL